MPPESQSQNQSQPQSPSPELQFLQLQTEANVLRARFSDALTESIRLQTLLVLSQSDCNALRSENDALRQAVEKLTAPASTAQPVQLLQPSVATATTESDTTKGNANHD